MSTRYEKFDILRGFAIIGVVLIHITAPLATEGKVLAVLVNQISRFAVPVFFFLSGWGLTIAESYAKSDGYWDFLKARFLSVFPQYIVWNFIYLAYSDVWSSQNLMEVLKAFLLGIIYNHLYFVPVILVLYVFYPLLLKVANKFGVLLSLFITMISQLSDVWIQHEYFYMNKNILNWIFYFIFGMWFAKNFKDKVQHLQKYKFFIWIGLVLSMSLVLLTPFLVGDLFDFNLVLASTRPTVIFYSTMLVLLMIVTPFNHQKLNKALLKLSKYSFYIYLSHYLFLSIWRDVYATLGWDWNTLLYIVFSFVLVMGVSYVVGVFMRKAEKKIGL